MVKEYSISELTYSQIQSIKQKIADAYGIPPSILYGEDNLSDAMEERAKIFEKKMKQLIKEVKQNSIEEFYSRDINKQERKYDSEDDEGRWGGR